MIVRGLGTENERPGPPGFEPQLVSGIHGNSFFLVELSEV